MPSDNNSTYVITEAAHLLFVDDDPILREFAQVSLATDAVEVDVAADGIDAMAMLEATNFDAVLLDLEMPRMDGFEFLSRLREIPQLRHLPVIVVTGREDLTSIDRAYRLGATAFTVKPLNWRLLSYQIRFVLRTLQAEREMHIRNAEWRSLIAEHTEDLDRLKLLMTEPGRSGMVTEKLNATIRALRAKSA
jgi:DNA-binding response OmpR family regulator